MANRPTAVTIRSYQVGFGDCFLVTIHYGPDSKSRRHVLIDFGSTGSPKRPKVNMQAIANDIASACSGKLTAVVATHRHADHISGFGGKTGRVIAALAPEVVIQPWTEDPEAAPNARRPTASSGRRAFAAALASMHQVAAEAVEEARAMPEAGARGLAKTVRGQLAFLGAANLKNSRAVNALMNMGKRQVYASHGSASGLEGLLPGVRVHVLGPPTIEQTNAIQTQRAQDPDEFWHLHARFWNAQARALCGSTRARNRAGGLFRRALRARSTVLPFETRWFLDRLHQSRGEQVLEIVRILDEAMNNTSLILLFEIGKKKLLFPGDAQIENWDYALRGSPDAKQVTTMLSGVDVYKVGHHGSLNATPKTLWGLFRKRGPATRKDRLRSFVSTMAGKHGSDDRGTEVPRKSLMDALNAETVRFTTQSLVKDFFAEVTIAI